MANNKHISPGDKDLKLAQEIGKVLPNTNELSRLNDPLTDALLSYKKAQDEISTGVSSDQIWSSIESEINAKPDKKASIFTLYPTLKRVAVAAGIIIVALSTFWIYQANRGDILIGESFASMEVIELSDGSMITLRPYSKLYQSSISAGYYSYRISGEAYFDVTPNPERIFSVSTSLANVEVLGTKFVLSDWGQTSEIYLEEGRVRFTSTSTLQSIELEDGQASEIDQSNLSPEIIETDPEEYKDWLNNELVFRKKSAEIIFKELEQHFNIRINTTENMDENDLSGSIHLDDLQSVLDNLELVLGGNFVQTGERTYSFKTNK